MRLRTERLTWREIEGEIVALDLETSSYFTGNLTASLLLKRMADGVESEDELVSALVTEFDVDPATATDDLRCFLEVLGEQGLLDPGAGGE